MRLLPLAFLCLRIGAAQTLSVCDVLHALDKYDGQLVTVRGRSTGSNEGAFLAGDCEEPLVTAGFAWPSVIELHYPDRRANPGDFDIAYRSSLELFEAVRKIGMRESDKLFYTVTGLLSTDKNLERRVITRSGVKDAVGFGAGNYAPATLETRTESDPELKRCTSIRPEQ